MAVCSVVTFLLGIVGGAIGSAVVTYCCCITRYHKPSATTATRASPTLASPVYDNVVVDSGPKPLELKENIAYGPIQIELKENVAYGPVQMELKDNVDYGPIQ